MTYIRSFENYAPPPRYEPNAEAFAGFELWEASTAEALAAHEGDSEAILTVTFEPSEIDTDPVSPRLRSFSTDQARFDPGYYQVVWVDGDGDHVYGPVQKFPILPAWAPGVADVAAYVRARTKAKGSGGTELGTFTADTRPTATEVEALIAKAISRVSSSIDGEPCTEALRSDAGDAAALYAAMLVEQSYYPETTNQVQSSFKALQSLWADAIKALAGSVARECGVGEGEEGGGSMAVAQGGYDDGRAMVGPTFPGNPRAAGGRAEGSEAPWPCYPYSGW